MRQTKITAVFFACGLGAAGLAFSPRLTAPSNRTSALGWAVLAAAAPPPVTLCDCYFSTDCKGRTALCQLGTGCLVQGKNDGKCQISGSLPPSANLNVAMSNEEKSRVVAERLALSSAVDFYFQGFLKAIENGGGHPDAKFVQAALNTHLSKSGHDRVELAVWQSPDAVMGWDFNYPLTFQRAEGFVGNIREVDGVGAATGIVDAARRGLLDALKTGDDSKVGAPLRAFWSKNPNYAPRHLGRCYPHGHAEIADMQAGIACQIDVLQRVAGMLGDTAEAEARAETVGTH